MDFQEGDKVFVRSNYGDNYVGRIVSIDLPYVTLNDVSWIYDSGVLRDFLRDGRTTDMDTVFMGDGITVYASLVKKWPHELFK